MSSQLRVKITEWHGKNLYNEVGYASLKKQKGNPRHAQMLAHAIT
jgi:hypothetical protein